MILWEKSAMLVLPPFPESRVRADVVSLLWWWCLNCLSFLLGFVFKLLSAPFTLCRVGVPTRTAVARAATRSFPARLPKLFQFAFAFRPTLLDVRRWWRWMAWYRFVWFTCAFDVPGNTLDMFDEIRVVFRCPLASA